MSQMHRFSPMILSSLLLALLLAATPISGLTAAEPGSIITGDINTSTTWTAADSPYVLSGAVTVAAGATLTVAQGAVVHANRGASLSVKGTLLAEGAPGQTISFGPNGNNTGQGDWQGLYFHPGSRARLRHVVLVHAGQPDGHKPMRTGIEVASANVLIENSTIADNLGPGIYATAPFTLTDSLITGNEKHAIHFDSAEAIGNTFHDNELSENGTDAYLVDAGRLLVDWQPDNAIDIDGTMTVSETVTMTVGPDTPAHILGTGAISVRGKLTALAGAEISAEGSAAIRVHGELNAIGSEERPVHFGPAGDTATLDDWRGLYFYDGSVGNLQHVLVQNAGRGDGLTPLQTGLEIDTAKMTIDHLTVRNTRGYAIYATADMTLTNSTITNNEHGVVVADNAVVTIQDSELFDNDVMAVDNRSPETAVQAANNWWGASSGPYHPELNPDGLGDVVSSGVLFTPWIQEDLPPEVPVIYQYLPTILAD